MKRQVMALDIFPPNHMMHNSWLQLYSLNSKSDIDKHKRFHEKKILVQFKKLDTINYRLYEYRVPTSDTKAVSPTYRFVVEKMEPKQKPACYKPVSENIECELCVDDIRLTVFHVHNEHYSQCLVLLLHYWAQTHEDDDGSPAVLIHAATKSNDEKPVNDFMKETAKVKFTPRIVSYNKGETTFKLSSL